MASRRAVESTPPETATTIVSPENGSLSLRHSASRSLGNRLMRTPDLATKTQKAQKSESLSSNAFRWPQRSRHTLLKNSHRLSFRKLNAKPRSDEQGAIR